MLQSVKKKYRKKLTSDPRYTIMYVILQIALFPLLPFFNLFKSFSTCTGIKHDLLLAKETLRDRGVCVMRGCINF